MYKRQINVLLTTLSETGETIESGRDGVILITDKPTNTNRKKRTQQDRTLALL